MISVRIEKCGQDYVTFQCKGHAGYAESGSDIVCAAVSVLVTNAENSLRLLAGESFETREEEGFVRFEFAGPLGSAGRLLMDSLALGLENIRRAKLPDGSGRKYLQIYIKEVTWS